MDVFRQCCRVAETHLKMLSLSEKKLQHHADLW